MDTINNLIQQVETDENIKYNSAWQSKAVDALNEYYDENGYTDDRIMEADGDEFKELIRYNLDSRGWLGLKYLLEEVDNTAEYIQLDVYGNAKSVDYDLYDLLKMTQ